MTDYVTTDSQWASYYDAVYGQRHNPLRFWDLPDLQAALNAAYSDLGVVRGIPEGDPDRMLLECLTEDTIGRLGVEMRRRIRGGQDLEMARKEAKRYPPELIARIKGAYDLRDMVARDLGLSKPIASKISSPLRDDDRTPSFRVDAAHFYDFGTHQHGDVIEWRMRWHHVTFWQAVESLATQAGIPLPREHAGGLRGLRIGRTHHA